MTTELAQREQYSVAAAPTPANMLSIAIEKGASMEQLEKLMALQERYEANEARKAYVTAMSQFKREPPKISKNKQVDFATSKGRTQYKHATLDHVCDVIGSALSVVGISYRWQTAQDGSRITVTCELTHNMGHSETTTLSADPDQSGGKNSIQAVGSTVTYLQRYTLLAAVGMATEDQDNDAITPPAPAPVQVPCVSKEQITNLENAVKVAGIKESAFFTRADIKAYSDLPANRYNGALSWIKSQATKEENTNA